MNRFVRLEDLLVRLGVLAIVLLLPCVLPSVVLGQQQSVPDAPTPQGPDSLSNITSGVTPGKGTQAPQDQNATQPSRRPAPATSQPARTRFSKPRLKFQRTANCKKTLRNSSPGSITFSSR
jgi:hypothetical protein